MRLAAFEHYGASSLGIVTGDGIVSVTRRLAQLADMKVLIADWASLKDSLEAMTGDAPDYALSDVRLKAPIARPGKLLAIGLNYADHIAESKMAMPTTQVWFCKQPTSAAGPYDDIPLPRVSTSVDYEVELVAVIGKAGRYISAENALDHVFGYCVGNDVSVRDWQLATPQWMLGKSFDGHAPFGPWITTPDEAGDPHAAAITATVNGEPRQSSNTRHLLFGVADQIAHLSQAMTLEPGDLIFTGTPSGVGAAFDPKRFLRPGDVVRCEVEGLGAIENRCAAD